MLLLFWREFDAIHDTYQRRRKKRKEAEQIANDLDRAIALAERALEEEEGRWEELQKITEIAERHHLVLIEMSPKLDKIIKEAVEQQTFSKMERLERELRRIKEEDDFLLEAIRILMG